MARSYPRCCYGSTCIIRATWVCYVLFTPPKSGFWILKPNENEKEVFVPRSSSFRLSCLFQPRHMLSYSDVHTCNASQNTTSSLTSNLRPSKAYFLTVTIVSPLAATLESKTKFSSLTTDEIILFFE